MKPSKCPSTHNRNFQDSTLKQGEVLNPKRFSEEEKRLYQNVFSPKIKHNPYKKRPILGLIDLSLVVIHSNSNGIKK